MRRLVCMLMTAAAIAVIPQDAAGQNGNQRSGFWFNGGLGYGSLGCQNCDGREGSISGGLALGGTLSDRILLGVASNGWTKEEDGARLTAGSLTALMRFYPSSTGAFFLTGGLGIGTLEANIEGIGSARETGASAVLGLGYDLRVGRNLSITPFWNGVGISAGDSDANFGQIGLGITIH